jgi:hypothetical protein
MFARGVALDRGFGCVHEHIDLSLQVVALGLPIYLEPQAKVLQLRDGDYLLSDLPLLRWRWNADAVEASIASFCTLWNIVPDEQAFRGVNIFTRDRRRHNDPIRRDLIVGPIAPLDPRALSRTPTALLRELESAGYDDGDRWAVTTACNLAAELHRDAFRAAGTPFIEHPIGVAGILARHRFSVPILLAALLHGAYTHGRLHADRPADLDEIAEQIATRCGATVERQVRETTRLFADPGRWFARHGRIETMRMSAVGPTAIAAADVIETVRGPRRHVIGLRIRR